MPEETPTLPSSCIPKEPFIKLAEGTAPVLEYNIPQTTCFPSRGYLPVAIPSSYWNSATSAVPSGNFWEVIKEYSVAEATSMIVGGLIANPGKPFNIKSAKVQRAFNAGELGVGRVKATVKSESGLKIPMNEVKHIGGVLADDVAQQIAMGYRPYYRRNLYGQQVLAFQAEPVIPKPRLVIVLHFRTCSWLGDYGAGKTLKTFSLLPGEKTEISIRTYKHRQTTKTKAENILDSFSQHSAQELETIVQNENTSANQYGSEESDTHGESNEHGNGLSYNLSMLGLNIGIGGGTATTTGGTNTSTVNSSAMNMMSQLNSAMDQHVSESSAAREITVNTEVSEMTEESEENAIIRRVENINLSRVLNFVYRQLLQEYITITYLEDVSFLYTNGYPETKRVVKLDGLEGLLKDVIKDNGTVSPYWEEVKDAILAELCSIYDYTGIKQSLLESVEENIDSCCGTGDVSLTRTYCRKKLNLSQTYEGITVPGIIMSVKNRVLRTDSVVCDALLGQGEALDCYNIHLQDAAVKNAELRNTRYETETTDAHAKFTEALSILTAITDPLEQAQAFKDMLKECCSMDEVKLLIGALNPPPTP